MRGRPAVACLLTLGVALTAAPGALAQAGRKLEVNGIRGISFGQLVTGLPRTITRTDPARAGTIELVGQNGDQILLHTAGAYTTSYRDYNGLSFPQVVVAEPPRSGVAAGRLRGLAQVA